MDRQRDDAQHSGNLVQLRGCARTAEEVEGRRIRLVRSDLAEWD